MVTITKVNDSIKFEFEDSQHYLVGNGEITVPMNSLMLTLDESNMATFKKIDGDPFISFLIEESNFADKDALLDFYETEMTGGAGLPIEEIQQMIDESISGISATSMSAVTYVNSWASGNINNQKVGFWWEKADGSSGKTTVLSAKTNGDISLIDNEITLNSAFTSTLITDAQYVGSANTINFLNSSGETIATIDTTDFVIDGMVEDVRIEEISGATYLVIDFNTASGQQDIQIPLTEIFDPSNYYNKSEIDGIVSGLNQSIDAKLDASAYTPTDLSEYWTSAQTESAITNAVSGKQDALVQGDGITISGNVISWSADKEEVIAKTFFQLNDKIGDLNETTDSLGDKINTKQDLLTAGSGITIVDNVISADGGSITVDPSLDSGSTNAVANSAITTAINSKQDAMDYFIITSYSPTVSTGSSSGINYTALTMHRINPKTRGENSGIYYLPFINGKSIFRDMNAKPLYDEFNLVETSAITSSITSASTDTEIPSAKAVYDALEGQSGGTTYSAGTNIEITTANTINCTLPITNLNNSSVSIGSNNTVNGYSSLAIGQYLSIPYNNNSSLIVGYDSYLSGDNSKTGVILCGRNCQSKNNYEATFGTYNVSNTGSTSADKTLLSVGNGTSSARHNAFEIRQNGDIYISSGGTDIKLQDNLGGGSITIDPSLDSGSTNAVANSAITEAIESKQKKLTAGDGIEIYNSSITQGREEGEIYDVDYPFYVITPYFDCPSEEEVYAGIDVDEHSYNVVFDILGGTFEVRENDEEEGDEVPVEGWDEYFTISAATVGDYNWYLVTPIQTLDSVYDNGCVRFIKPSDISFDTETFIKAHTKYISGEQHFDGSYITKNFYLFRNTEDGKCGNEHKFAIFVDGIGGQYNYQIEFDNEANYVVRDLNTGEETNDWENYFNIRKADKGFVIFLVIYPLRTLDYVRDENCTYFIYYDEFGYYDGDTTNIIRDLDNGKQNKLTAGSGIEITDNIISVTGGSIDSGAVQSMIDASISGKADSSAVTQEINAAVSGKVDTSDVTSSVTSGSTDVITSGGIYEQLGGLKFVKLTQNQYDALSTKDSNTIYFIKD